MITDITYSYEVEAIKRRGGVLVNINTPEHFLEHPPHHSPGVVIIEDSGTPQELEEKIALALELKLS